MKKSIGKKVAMRGKPVNKAGLRNERAAVIEVKGSGYKDMPTEKPDPQLRPSTNVGASKPTLRAPQVNMPRPTVNRDYNGLGNNPYWRDRYISRLIK